MRLAFLSIGRHIHTERWIQYFVNKGHECHLLTVQPGPVEGVTVHDVSSSVGPKPWRYFLSMGKIKKVLQDIKPDLLNTHFLTGYGYWGHFSGFHPNVLTVWGDDVYVTPFESRLKNYLARKALGSCDALTGDSADILADCASLGADATNSYRVLWGVNFKKFMPFDASHWRRELGFDDDQILFFSPRSYTQPYYNIDTVIAAAAKVQAEEPRARFLFAGYEGDPEPFRQKAREAGIDDVMAMVGRLPHDEFATALNACDVFISVPSVDATAVSLLEAMCCGTGIIVSSLPSAMEWIEDGRSGLVVEPRNVGQLAQAMLRFSKEDEFRLRAGLAALDTARQYAGFKENMDYVGRIFSNLTSGTEKLPKEISLPVVMPGGKKPVK